MSGITHFLLDKPLKTGDLEDENPFHWGWKTYSWIDGLAFSKLQASLDFEGVERNSDLKHAKAWEMFVEVFVPFILSVTSLKQMYTFAFLESK